MSDYDADEELRRMYALAWSIDRERRYRRKEWKPETDEEIRWTNEGPRKLTEYDSFKQQGEHTNGKP